MGSRTSIYTSALQLPDWVMGGDYGDLSKIMNARDVSYENVAQEQQQTDLNDINLDEKKRKKRVEDILAQQTGTGRPATIRDAYDQMINASYEAGDPVSAIGYQIKKQEYEQDELKKRRAEVTGALGLADNLDYSRIGELYPGAITQSDYNKNQRRKAAGSERTYPMYNTETKKLDPAVPYSEAMKRQESGKWIFTKDPAFNDGGLNLGFSGGDSGDGGMSGGLFDSLFGGKPGESPTEKQKQRVEGLPDTTPGKGAEQASDKGGTPKSSIPPRPPKPGMKWQQNKITGEFREVPA